MYFTVKVKIATDTPKGVKWNSELYLVSATSVTEAEQITASEISEETPGLEYEITAVAHSKICKVL